MRFSTIFSVAAMVTGIVAEGPTPVKRDATLVARDVATVKSVFANIGSLTDQLNSDVGSYDGSFGTISDDSDAILDAIKSGTSDISSSGDLSQTEALQLQPLVKTLQGKISNVVDSLVAAKSQLVSDGFGQDVLESLQSQKTASQSLADATTALVPQSLQAIAAQLASGITKELDQGIAAFQGTGSGSSSSSSSASATTTEESSSTSATTGSGTVITTKPSSPVTVSSYIPSGTGSYTPTSPVTTSPIPTNAAALKAVSGAAGVAAIFAAMIGL